MTAATTFASGVSYIFSKNTYKLLDRERRSDEEVKKEGGGVKDKLWEQQTIK